MVLDFLMDLEFIGQIILQIVQIKKKENFLFLIKNNLKAYKIILIPKDLIILMRLKKFLYVVRILQKKCNCSMLIFI